jgi:hypothetical protein
LRSIAVAGDQAFFDARVVAAELRGFAGKNLQTVEMTVKSLAASLSRAWNGSRLLKKAKVPSSVLC